MANINEKKVPRTWDIKRTDETEGIFDIKMQLDLSKKKAMELMRQLDMIKDEVSYKKKLMWNEIENCIGTGHDINLTILSDESDMDTLKIKEKLEDDDSEGLLGFLRKLSGE